MLRGLLPSSVPIFPWGRARRARGGPGVISPLAGPCARAPGFPSMVGTTKPTARTAPQPLGENVRPFHNLEALAARLRTRLTPAPQLAAREGLGAPSAEACGPGDGQLCAHTWGLRPGGTERAAHLERAQLPAGDLGVLPGSPPEPGRRRPGSESGSEGGGTAMLQLSPGKTPARGGGGGPLPGTKGTKAARGRMQSWKNPSGRRGGGGRGGAAGAQQPGRPHQPPGRDRSRPLPQSAPRGRSGRLGETEYAGGEGWAGDREPEPPGSGCCGPARPPCTRCTPAHEGRVAALGTHAALHTATWP